MYEWEITEVDKPICENQPEPLPQTEMQSFGAWPKSG